MSEIKGIREDLQGSNGDDVGSNVRGIEDKGEWLCGCLTATPEATVEP